MDRISRALEIARANRAAPRRAASFDTVRLAVPPVNPVVADDGQGAAGPEFTDTITFDLPILPVRAETLERERILGPGITGPGAAAHRMLRTQVLKRLDQQGINTLAIVGAAPGAGKTLTAINLAIAISADPGRTALLVDFDLRNPSIHRRFDVTPARGVEDCLQGRRPVQECMVKIAGYERLTLLPALGTVDGSSELLSSARTAELVVEMRERYANRVLIFDLPPVLQADDALAVSRVMQAGLLVVAESRTRRADVRRTLQLLRDLPIVGTVLNGSRSERVACY